MPETTNELMFELLKKMHHRLDKVDFTLVEIRNEMQSVRGTMLSMQQDLHNIYGVLGRHEQRLDRIESRLELRELAEVQARFEQHP
ncbi:hypothetical protein MRS76_15245 [Rhizobiaceae bacterium n13]|uniref:Uncharacterized protein n=1 Tax=Ferirhizobium litorale TaxID=2927786 RepID=A0AAE3QGZ6_9HYPH|nr:hypothetical protein [Fererhizobium litorale]MDI7863313.1 hypothetical protein [Fererhizobium litorale]MDI7922953.1 hypothetical protein [Fererhizobium litorale]